jgi:DNA-binding MarR family transcriptional regulator
MDPLRRTLTNPSIERLLKVIEVLRLLDREMPAQVLASFLYVASHDSCHKQAMEEDLSFTTASSSRNTDWLSKFHRLNKPGLGLIVKEADPSNRRRQILRLTPKGERLIHQIEDILYGP